MVLRFTMSLSSQELGLSPRTHQKNNFQHLINGVDFVMSKPLLRESHGPKSPSDRTVPRTDTGRTGLKDIEVDSLTHPPKQIIPAKEPHNVYDRHSISPTIRTYNHYNIPPFSNHHPS